MKNFLSKISESFKLFEFFQDIDGNFSSKRLINIAVVVLTIIIIYKASFAMIDQKAWDYVLYLVGGLGVFILILTKIITVENIKQIISIVKGAKED
jgi:hypothetical protein